MPVYHGFGYSVSRMVKTLLIVNIGIFIFTSFAFSGQYLLFRLFGLVPNNVNHLMIWQFFTYMFLHASMGHIFFNMFALWMFGTELEYNWGSRDFIKYYIVCGIGGGILVWLTSFVGLSNPAVPTIGASGAIFGLLVAFAMMWPDRLIFVFGIFPMKALHLVLLFGGMDLLSGLRGAGGGIAVFAHVGGGVTGFIYLKYGWRIMIYLESWAKRRKFRVIQGGASKKTDLYSSDDASHPDLEEEVDRILDKIAREGMASLTTRERRLLDRVSRKKQR